MLSPGIGLGWCLWRRHRVGIGLLTAYMILLTAVVRIAPLNLRPVLAIPSIFGLLYLIGIFANADADLISTRSGYPGHLLSLPIRTRALVFWPMMYGILGVVLAWVVFATMVLTPGLVNWQLWCPAALLAALMACMQAISWYPAPLPYVRGVLGGFALVGLALFGALGWTNGVSPLVMSSVYVAAVPLAAIIALHGVATARTGGAKDRTLPMRAAPPSMSELTARPFASAAQAQLWLEWKRNGPILPALTLFCCGVLFLLPILVLGRDEPFVSLGIGNIQVNVVHRIWLLSLPETVLCGMVVGCCPRKADTLRLDLTLQPFLATRPLSSVELVVCKLKMAARSTLTAWGIVLLVLMAWLLLPAESGGRSGTIGGLALSYLSPKSYVALALLLLLLIGATWTAQVSGLWIELSGLRWLIVAFRTALPICLSSLVAGAVVAFVRDRALVSGLIRALPSILCGLALLKVFVAVTAISALQRSHLLAAQKLATIAGVWLAIVAGLCALVVWLFPTPYLLPRYEALSVFLMTPFSRLLLAPLAIHWNRHR